MLREVPRHRGLDGEDVEELEGEADAEPRNEDQHHSGPSGEVREDARGRAEEAERHLTDSMDLGRQNKIINVREGSQESQPCEWRLESAPRLQEPC